MNTNTTNEYTKCIKCGKDTKDYYKALCDECLKVRPWYEYLFRWWFK